MGNSNFNGVWGFKIVPGHFAGGGLFSRVSLEIGESLIESVLSTRQGPGWIDTHGYLTLTDRRVIFTPYRWPVLGRPLAVPYRDVANAETARRRNPGSLASFMADALVIRTRHGGTEIFWAAMPAEQLVKLIQPRLARA